MRSFVAQLVLIVIGSAALAETPADAPPAPRFVRRHDLSVPPPSHKVDSSAIHAAPDEADWFTPLPGSSTAAPRNTSHPHPTANALATSGAQTTDSARSTTSVADPVTSDPSAPRPILDLNTLEQVAPAPFPTSLINTQSIATQGIATRGIATRGSAHAHSRAANSQSFPSSKDSSNLPTKFAPPIRHPTTGAVSKATHAAESSRVDSNDLISIEDFLAPDSSTADASSPTMTQPVSAVQVAHHHARFALPPLPASEETDIAVTAHWNNPYAIDDSAMATSVPPPDAVFIEPGLPFEEAFTPPNLQEIGLAPMASLGGRLGSDRSILDIRAVLPIWKSDLDVVFAEMRGRFDDRDASEGYFGTGLRTFVTPDWIAGLYGYYDLRRTTQRNHFHQLTTGIEALSLDWDVRINGYFDIGGSEVSPVVRGVSNGTIVTQNSIERAGNGFDLEIGRRLLYWGWNDSSEVRGFIGYYYIDNQSPGVSAIEGPDLRIEYRCYDLSWLGPQSRFEAGFEYTNDNVRNDQYWAFARLHIPLSPRWDRPQLDPMTRRMSDLRRREID